MENTQTQNLIKPEIKSIAISCNTFLRPEILEKTLKKPLTMMKKASVNKCNINSDNVYDNSSGINFTEVYAEYNYSPLTN